jgi:DNA-binding transcriptional LysR family regulator
MSDRLLNDRLDWNLLRTFRVIGQELSISRAAARLHLTQPAVSQALKRLEEQLGRQLIARRGPRFVLTEMGEQLFQLLARCMGRCRRSAACSSNRPMSWSAKCGY